MIVSFLNQKGGVGKTTLSINTAVACFEAGLRTLVVDADPQASCLEWSAARNREPLFPVIGMAKATLHRDLPSIAADYDLTIIDGAPRVNEFARSALLASDMVFIPLQPSPVDVWATDEVVALVREAQNFRPGLRAAFVINRKITNTVIGRSVVKAFSDQPFPVLDQQVCQRVVFAECFAEGLGVLEAEPRGSAADEIRELAQFICKTKQRLAA